MFVEDNIILFHTDLISLLAIGEYYCGSLLKARYVSSTGRVRAPLHAAINLDWL